MNKANSTRKFDFEINDSKYPTEAHPNSQNGFDVFVYDNAIVEYVQEPIAIISINNKYPAQVEDVKKLSKVHIKDNATLTRLAKRVLEEFGIK